MNYKKIIIVIATVIVLGAACFGLYHVLSRNTLNKAGLQPKETAARLITALAEGEVSRAYSYGTSFYQSKNSTQAVEKFSESVHSDNIKISNEELYIGTGDVSDRAIYLAYVENLPPSSKGSTTGTFVVRLVKEDGSWKVDSLEVK